MNSAVWILTIQLLLPGDPAHLSMNFDTLTECKRVEQEFLSSPNKYLLPGPCVGAGPEAKGQTQEYKEIQQVPQAPKERL